MWIGSKTNIKAESVVSKKFENTREKWQNDRFFKFILKFAFGIGFVLSSYFRTVHQRLSVEKPQKNSNFVLPYGRIGA